MNARCMIETKQQPELRANCLHFNKRFSKGIVGVHLLFSFFLLSVLLSSSWWLFLILSRLFLSLTLSVSLSRSLSLSLSLSLSVALATSSLSLALSHSSFLLYFSPFSPLFLLSLSLSLLSPSHVRDISDFKVHRSPDKNIFYKLAHCWK